MQDISCVAFADSIDYSDVLDDLKKDEKFNANDYPTNLDDYSLNFIQIAEGVNKDIFVYVYQPSSNVKNYHASSINISTSINNGLAPRNYKLQFCNSNDVFFKYRVVDLQVSDSNIRYYTISSILRPFDDSVDEKSSGGNEISEVPFTVSKQFAFGTVNGESYVECVDIESIEITDKFVGFVRYPNGYGVFSAKSCDSYFVAFNTDKPMDKLLEADVYYTSQACKKNDTPLDNSVQFFDVEEQYAYLTYTQKGGNSDSGWFADSYSWDRIQTVDAFLLEVEGKNTIYSGAMVDVSIGSELTDSAQNELRGKRWVLRFVETAYTETRGAAFSYVYNSTIVGNVMILRLKFETDGVVYNLGVIDNKQTGSDSPVNDNKISVDLNDSGKLIVFILSIVALIIIIVLLAPILPYILKAIWWIITLPFKAIGRVAKSFKNYNDKHCNVPSKSEISKSNSNQKKKKVKHAKKKETHKR